MSITDELRDYVIDADGMGMTHGHAKCIYAIADRIDREHRSALEKLAAQVDESERSGFDQGFASADDWLAQHEDAMAEHGWVRLPVDADGVPIRVGDVMEGEKIGGGFCEPFEVVGYIMSNGELEPMDEHKLPRKRKYLRHHHAPTVEDVLREFAEKMNENMGMYTGEAIDADEWRDADRQTIAEYAAKLRLAEEVDK